MAGYPWPDLPIRTYVENSTPTIKADDLNEFQQTIARIYGAVAGTRGTIINEDFIYSRAQYTAANDLIGRGVFAVNATSNTVLETGYGGAAAGSENNSFGQLFITCNNGGAGIVKSASAYQRANRYGAANDFAFRTRYAVLDRTQLDATSGMSVTLNTTGGNIGFYANSTSANWQLRKFSLATSDTGIAIVNDQPAVFETIRVGETISYYVNGILITTEPFTGGILQFKMHIDFTSASNTVAVNTVMARVDYAKLELDRV